MEKQTAENVPDRRAFLKKSLAIMLGGACALAPLGAGLAVLLEPLRRTARAGNFLPVANLPALPEDGTPRKFSVIDHRHDAWNRFPEVPVGAVYLRRTGPQTVQALQVACPHAGCFVDFHPDKRAFLCPCHNSSFSLDGRVADPQSPSPRGMDELEVEIRNGTEVWVKYQTFLAGRPEKIPPA